MGCETISNNDNKAKCIKFQLENDMYYKDESHERRYLSELSKNNAKYQMVYFAGGSLVLMYLLFKI